MKSPIVSCAIILALSFGALNAVNAGSATWNLNSTNGDWNTPANWSPSTVPNGPNDVATFSVSTQIQVSVSANIEVNRIVFAPGASPYTITANAPNLFTISGAGITNNSGTTQNFASSGVNVLGNLFFSGNATAGSQTVFTASNGAHIRFLDTSTAGDATFTDNDGGFTSFSDSSHAGNAIFFNNDGRTSFFGESNAENATVEMNGSFMEFTGSASAGNGIFTLNNASAFLSGFASADSATFTVNGGVISFTHGATAANATLTSNGGTISLRNGLGGTARIVMDNSLLDLNLRHSGLVSLGSIEGSGQINLRNNSLSVGANNLSTVFSGNILGHSPGGSIVKAGSGTFTLTGGNEYGGQVSGTVVAGGVLLISNTTGSGTGKGAVTVSNATLGGSGAIAGDVALGQFASGVLAPSEGGTAPVTLLIRKTLSFFSRSTYKVTLDSQMHATDAVSANGISIDGARFSIADLSSVVLPIGLVFTVIQNTSTDAIAGTFANLPDGSTITVGPNTFQVSYQGGDGNDLTLTVVP